MKTIINLKTKEVKREDEKPIPNELLKEVVQVIKR